uniref:Uncharacterized protein n=1 Tax=Panagrolaimus superbus TaxID=310955 RepID=A0A914YMA5_9BILA
MEKMTSNITDIDPGQKLHFFITSLFSNNFFYNYEFFETSPSNIQLIDNVKVVKWWNPDILFRYGESVTRFELFKRRMKIGYSKFGESLVSAITILPTNFNDLERNVDIDAIYGDKIVVLTQKFAKLYYIVSKVIEAEKYDFFGQNSVITFTFIYKKSISMELHKVENGEISLLERMEKRFLVLKESETELLSNIESIQNHLNSGYEKSDLNVIFFDYNIGNMDQSKYNEYFIIERKNLTEDDLMHAGAVFKAKSDFIGNIISFVDITKILKKKVSKSE